MLLPWLSPSVIPDFDLDDDTSVYSVTISESMSQIGMTYIVGPAKVSEEEESS